MGECNWGIVWSVLNLICGIVITAASAWWAFSGDGFLCGWYNVFFGVAIIWVSITTKCCDKYALAWFPFWGNFLFMGCVFLYLACGGFSCWDSLDDWCFGFFFVAVVGIIYVILWLIKTLAGVDIPDPIPLEVESLHPYFLLSKYIYFVLSLFENSHVVEEVVMDIKKCRDLEIKN